MNTDISTTAGKPIGATAVALSKTRRRGIFLYLGLLILLLDFGAPHAGLIDIPISFLLKNKLHLSADELAVFRLIAAVPLILSFVFGFARDTWNPLGLRDRGFMLIFGTICAAFYFLFALTTPTYAVLAVAIILLTTSFLFVASAQSGLASVIGQKHAMTGQISAAWNIFASLPTIAALLIGGEISDALGDQSAGRAASLLFICGGTIMAAVAVFSFWKPAVVYDNLYAERTATHPLADLRRLVRHWPIYPALLIWTLWNFAPGSVTPLQYYLQNTLGARDAQWGQWNAIFTASFIPTFIVFGLLCRRFALRTLLWWGTLVAVPQLVPLLFINSVSGALIAAVPIGLMGGVATAAYQDLIIRSCPPGLEGTMLMLSGSLYYVASRFGDVLGASLYDHYGGFTVCVIAITIAYALILPALLLVPKDLIATADGEATPSAL